MISSSSPSEPSTSSSSSDSDSSSVSDSSSDSSSFSGSFPLPLASFAIFYGTSSKRPAQHHCWRWELVTRVASAAGEKVSAVQLAIFWGRRPATPARSYSLVTTALALRSWSTKLSLPPSELIGFGR